MTAHARAGRNGDGVGLDVPDDHARGGDIDVVGADVAGQLAAHGDRGRAYLTLVLGTGLDTQISLDLHVALEGAGDAHVSGAGDLALDRQAGGDQRLAHLNAFLRARTRGVRVGRRFGGRPF